MSSFEPGFVMRLAGLARAERARVEEGRAERARVEEGRAERARVEEGRAEQALVEGVRAERATACETGVPSCLRQALREYSRYVIGLLGRLGVASADVEDVAQEVYLAIHAQLPSFEARTSFKTWLCGVCRHKAADYRRKRVRRHVLASSRPPELPPEGECPQGQLLEREAKEVLRQALARLPEEQLEVFVLHAVEDLPMKDVATLVSCPLDTAYTRYRVALQRVKAFCSRVERATGKP